MGETQSTHDVAVATERGQKLADGKAEPKSQGSPTPPHDATVESEPKQIKPDGR